MVIISEKNIGTDRSRSLRSFRERWSFYLNDQEYLLECGDFIIVNSNEVHSIHAPKENMTVVLQMPLNMFEKYYTGDQFICFAHAPQAQDEQLMEMICEMYMAYSDKHCGYDLKIQSLFYDMLYLMVTRYREINVHPDILHQHKQLTKLSVITDYMKEHYKDELSFGKTCRDFRVFSILSIPKCFKNMQESIIKTICRQSALNMGTDS